MVRQIAFLIQCFAVLIQNIKILVVEG